MESAVVPVSRPLSQQRPTQAYYVPRRLLERVAEPSKESKEVDDSKKGTLKLQSSKETNERKENVKPKKSGQKSPKTRSEPRPLMSEILPKPEYLRDKRNQRAKASSSQKDIPAPVIEKLKELTTSVPRIISPKGCSSSLLVANPFLPRETPEKDRQCCGAEFLAFSPEDIRSCPESSCRSIQIFALPLSNETPN